MKQLGNWLALAILIFAVSANAARAQQSPPAAPHTVDLKSTDGTLLKATFFPAVKQGPGVLLFHQSNRTRTSWNELPRQLAAHHRPAALEPHDRSRPLARSTRLLAR